MNEWDNNDCDHPTDAIKRIDGPPGIEFEYAIMCEDCGAIDV